MTVRSKKWDAQAAEYFRNFADGRYDETAQLHFIYPESKTYATNDGTAFVIGCPGTDGLEFAYRVNMPGIWVWYPIDNEWRKIAETLAMLERDWRSGALKV